MENNEIKDKTAAQDGKGDASGKNKVTTGDRLLKKINTAGHKMIDFASTTANNASKILAVPIIAGAIWGSGIGLGITEQSVITANKNKQTAYEKTVGEIIEKRSKFVMAGASNSTLAEFDAQNPQPEKPAEKVKATAGDYAKSSLMGAILGAACGMALSFTAASGMHNTSYQRGGRQDFVRSPPPSSRRLFRNLLFRLNI
jgi:hypothetical protein